MTKRLIETIGTIKVYYNSRFNEYSIVNPMYPIGHDARETFTDSYSDAIGTARFISESKGESQGHDSAVSQGGIQ